MRKFTFYQSYSSLPDITSLEAYPDRVTSGVDKSFYVMFDAVSSVTQANKFSNVTTVTSYYYSRIVTTVNIFH